MNAARQIGARAGRSPWIPALVIAGGAHAAFFLLHPTPRPPRLPRTGPPARIAFQPPTADRSGRSIWSPVLFSLPTAVGFSRAQNTAADVRPPLEGPPLPTRFLPAPPATPLGPAVLPRRDLAREAGEYATAMGPGRLDQARVLAPPPPRSATEVAFLGPWAADPPAAPAALRTDLPALDKPWDCLASVSFDDRGEARHVFVEDGGAPPEIRAALEHVLRAWRLGTPRPGLAGRLRVRYEPAPRPPPKG